MDLANIHQVQMSAAVCLTQLVNSEFEKWIICILDVFEISSKDHMDFTYFRDEHQVQCASRFIFYSINIQNSCNCFENEREVKDQK